MKLTNDAYLGADIYTQKSSSINSKLFVDPGISGIHHYYTTKRRMGIFAVQPIAAFR